MIKLSASVSKKVPLPEVEFSSQSYSAGMEVEVASDTQPEELHKKLRFLYGLLEESIDEQIREAQGASEEERPRPPQPEKQGAGRPRGRETTRNGNGRRATEAQVRAIQAIAGERGYSEQALQDLLAGSYGVDAPAALSIGQASSVIDLLKKNGKE